MCFACENALTHWDVTDDPMVEHKTWYPHCPFVQGKVTGNIPRKRGLVPKPPTPPAGGLDVSGGWGVGLVLPDGETNSSSKTLQTEYVGFGSRGAGEGLTAKLSKATSGLGSYIQQLQRMDPTVPAPRPTSGGRPVSVPKLFSAASEPHTPPAVESVDIVFRGRQPGKQKKGDAVKKEAVSPASQVLLSMWETTTGLSGAGLSNSPDNTDASKGNDEEQGRLAVPRETSPDRPAETKLLQSVLVPSLVDTLQHACGQMRGALHDGVQGRWEGEKEGDVLQEGGKEMQEGGKEREGWMKWEIYMYVWIEGPPKSTPHRLASP